MTCDANDLIWINVCEPSGDMHGAALAKALWKRDSGLRLAGMVGPSMREAGVEEEFDAGLVSLVGLVEVFGKLPQVIRTLRSIRKRLAELRPKAVVLIDAPDFNFRVARMAHKLGIPVFYYISPQVWAWRANRVHFLGKYCRRVLTILPFEKEFFAERGVDVDYVGHPLLDLIPFSELDRITPDPNRIGILPGSRRKEIQSLLPEFAGAAAILAGEYPDLRFSMARAPGVDESLLRSLWHSDVPVDIVEPKDRYPMMREASFLIACSGTVTLEAALIGTPGIVGYKLSPITVAVGRLLIDIKYISLPNFIVDHMLYRDAIQKDAEAEPIAAKAREWLDDPGLLTAFRDELKDLRTMVGEPGVSDRAARIILDYADACPC